MSTPSSSPARCLWLAALTCWLAPVGAIQADEPPEVPRIGLGELIDVLVRRSPDLAKARAEETIARAEARSARGVDDWAVEADLSATRARTSAVPGQPVQTTSQRQRGGSVGLSRALPIGGELRATVSATEVREVFLSSQGEGEPQRSVSSITEASARLELSQSLLRGRGRAVARADRQKASLSAQVASARARIEATRALRETLAAYWELIYASDELETRRASLASSRQQLAETRVAVREGVRSSADLKAAEHAVAVREESLLAAEIALEERSLSLRRLAGLELSARSFALWPQDRPALRERAYEVEQTIQRAVARNPALVIAALQGKVADVDLGVARNGLLPRLDVTLGAGVRGRGGNVDDALVHLEDGDVDLSGAVSFRWELGRNAAVGQRDAAVQRRRVARIDLEEARREVMANVVLALRRLMAARKRLAVSRQAVELAKGTLEAERASFLVGRSTNHDVFQRQDELDRDRLSTARAEADLHQAAAELASLTDDLLGEYGVVVLEKTAQ